MWTWWTACQVIARVDAGNPLRYDKLCATQHLEFETGLRDMPSGELA